MKLLDAVNNILSDMNSFPVSSIWDDVEAEQVAHIIQNTYNYMLTTRKWPSSRGLIALEASTDPARPTHMRIPESTITLESVRYNVEDTAGELVYREIEQVDPEHFLQMTNSLPSDNTDRTMIVTDYSGVDIKIALDVPPRYYTSFDDKHIVFNSYDSSVEDTLQSSKVACLGYSYPAFILSDSFEPDMPDTALQLLISDAKSHCFVTLKQSANAKEEQRARRLSSWLSREKYRNGEKASRYPNYGRK